MNSQDAESLIKAQREVKEPFRLKITSPARTGSGEITIIKVLRLLPGKRIVAIAEDGDALILVKIFVGRFSSRYTRREAAGVAAIDRAGVNTPRLLWEGQLRSGGGHVLAFEYLSEAQNLIDAWHDATSNATRVSLTLKVMMVLANLHQRGVIQNDIHPENFLLFNNTIYTIDGGDVSYEEKAGQPIALSETGSLANLALYFAQFLAKYDHYVPEALEAYRQNGDGNHRLGLMIGLQI